jgi:uncharacterized protein (TIGR02217 family)
MTFHENSIFPTNISKGSRGGPGGRHSVLTLDSGADVRIARWPKQRLSFDVRYGIRSFEDLQTIHDFYRGRSGILHGFRFFHDFDHSTASDHRSAPSATDVNIGTGDGSETTFQMVKKYVSGDQTITRTIEKPIDGTCLVAVAGSTKTEGTEYTIDYSTGEIEFDGAYIPTSGQAITWGGDFHVPCQFGVELDDVLEISWDAYEAGAIPSIPIVEMVGNVSTPDVPYKGGGSEQDITADTLYDFAWGCSVHVTPDAAGHNLVLPYLDDLPNGFFLFHFANASGSYSVTLINRSTGATVHALAASSAVLLGIYESGGVKAWIKVS